MQRFRFTLLLAVFAAAAAWTNIAHAGTQIYLAEYKYNDPRLYVMDPGGESLQELHIIPNADWLVVGLQIDNDAGKIYWTHGSYNAGRISRANLDGTEVEVLITGLTNPRGLALDPLGGKMYWSDTQDNRLYRANLDGSDLETVIDTGDQLGRPTVDLANSKLYFGNYGEGDMRRANLDGSDQEILFSDLYTPVAVDLDLDAAKIYWADSNTSYVSNHIARSNFDGTDREILYQGQPTSSGFTGIGLDLPNQRLYWCDEITDIEKGLWESGLDGSDAQRIFASPAGWNAGAMTVVITANPCPADVNNDEVVDIDDLFQVLSAWGDCDDCPEDVDGSGIVDIDDVFAILGDWGPCSLAVLGGAGIR